MVICLLFILQAYESLQYPRVASHWDNITGLFHVTSDVKHRMWARLNYSGSQTRTDNRDHVITPNDEFWCKTGIFARKGYKMNLKILR